MILLLWSASFIGCARWNRPSWSAAEKTEETKSTIVPVQSTPAPDSVSIETVMVRFDETELNKLDQSWLAADESVIDIEHRKLLDMNGIRVGVIRGDLPQPIVHQLELSRSQQRSDVVEQLGLGADTDSRTKLLSCRAGRRKDLVIRRELQQPLSVVTAIGGSVSGHLFDRASAVFALTMYPQADSTAIAELIPEVQYGEQRKSFVTGDFGMRQELKRESKLWKQLKIRVSLATNDVLMISTTSPSKALGHAFFTTQKTEQAEQQTVLLVRLASTQLDDLFDVDIVDRARAMMEKQ
jgi:hypothetical protein